MTERGHAHLKRERRPLFGTVVGFSKDDRCIWVRRDTSRNGVPTTTAYSYSMHFWEPAEAKPEQHTITQCKTCPWKVGADPHAIQNYVPELARALTCTIAKDPMSSLAPVLGGSLRMMACHYSKPGEEFPCAGWLENQLGPGNNIGLRLLAIQGKVPVPVTEGEQHERYEDTLPCGDALAIEDYCDLED